MSDFEEEQHRLHLCKECGRSCNCIGYNSTEALLVERGYRQAERDRMTLTAEKLEAAKKGIEDSPAGDFIGGKILELAACATLLAVGFHEQDDASLRSGERIRGMSIQTLVLEEPQAWGTRGDAAQDEPRSQAPAE